MGEAELAVDHVCVSLCVYVCRALAAIQATAGPEFPRLVSELNPELRRVLERKFT